MNTHDTTEHNPTRCETCSGWPTAEALAEALGLT